MPAMAENKRTPTSCSQSNDQRRWLGAFGGSIGGAGRRGGGGTGGDSSCGGRGASTRACAARAVASRARSAAGGGAGATETRCARGRRHDRSAPRPGAARYTATHRRTDRGNRTAHATGGATALLFQLSELIRKTRDPIILFDDAVLELVDAPSCVARRHPRDNGQDKRNCQQREN